MDFREGGRLRGDLVLAGTAARTLAGDHHSLEEELTAPDTPGLAALECSVEACAFAAPVVRDRKAVAGIGTGLVPSYFPGTTAWRPPTC